MTDSKQNEDHPGFTILAKQIDSKIDPDFDTLLKHIEIWNEMLSCDMFGNEELIPVGSCVDGSKVTVPSDCGDMDLLMVSNKIILKECLFDYDKSFPAFLHIRVNNEHQNYFKNVKDPIEGVYLPAAVLKELFEKSSFLSKWLLRYDIHDVLSEDGKFLKVTRLTSVGKEQMQLFPEEQNAFDPSDIPDTLKFNLTRMEKFAKCAFGRLMIFVKQTEGTHADDESSTFETNSRLMLTDYDDTSLLEMLNKFLDMIERNETDCGIIGNIPERNRNSQTDAVYDKKGSAMQGTTYIENIEKKDNKTPRDTFPTDSLRGNAHKRKLSRDRPATKTKRNEFSLDSKLDNKHKNKNAINSDLEAVTVSRSEGECIKKSTAKHKTSFTKLKSIDFVPAFKFEGWPRVADEWVTRSRKWPSKVILKKVVESGCQVVAKRPLALYSKPIAEERDPYFRLSFALSEIILAQSMKEQQLLCWRVLKAYQKCFLETKPKCLTSYHWKNVMFWVNEDLDESFWTDDNVLVAVNKCLDYMADCLKKRNLPFYFVRRMNLLNGRDETLFCVLREQVELIRREPLAYLKRFISEPPNSETHFMDIEKIEGALSEETKGANIDRSSEELANCFSLNFLYESDESPSKAVFQFFKAITHLLKKWRSEVDERSLYNNKDTQNTNNLQEKLFLDIFEKMLEAMKTNSKEGLFETIDLILTAMDNVPNNEDGTDSERAISQSFANMLRNISSALNKTQDYGSSENMLSNFYSSLYQHVMLMQEKIGLQYKTIRESYGKESEKLNEISFKLIANGAVAKLMEGIQKSTKNENKTFSLVNEIRKILKEAARKIGAITGRKSKTERKAEMDIELD